MTFKIDGIDMAPYLAYEGFKWEREDVDSADSCTALNGLTYRGRVTSKINLDITCRPLLQAEAEIVLNAILPEYVSVSYTDPMYGSVTKTMYSNGHPATFLMEKGEEELWGGIAFKLEER